MVRKGIYNMTGEGTEAEAGIGQLITLAVRKQRAQVDGNMQVLILRLCFSQLGPMFKF